MFASNLWLEKIRQVSSSVKLKRQIFFQSMRLYGLPWTLPPRLGIVDSYFFSSFSQPFCEHLPWASEFPAQHSAGCSDREAVVPVPMGLPVLG